MSKKAPYQTKTLKKQAKKCLIIKLEKFLTKKPHQESKIGALSRNLNKSLKRCLFKNPHKIPYQKSKKTMPYQGT